MDRGQRTLVHICFLVFKHQSLAASMKAFFKSSVQQNNLKENYKKNHLRYGANSLYQVEVCQVSFFPPSSHGISRKFNPGDIHTRLQ